MKALPLLAVLLCCGVSAFAYLSLSGNESAPAPAEKGPRIMTAADLASWQPLEFGGIYVHPAGPKGFELSEKARSLEGGKVALRGFMVRYPHPDPSLFLFGPARMFHDFAEYRLADSLSPETFHVVTNVPEGKAYRYHKDEMILLGTVEYGARQEMDGRISHLRLRLDHAVDAASGAELDLSSSLAMQRERLFNAERLKNDGQLSP